MGARRFTEKEHKRIINPLVDRLEKKHNNKPFVVGMQGGQGTGKTTILKHLHKELQQRGYNVASFSIDDFYETITKRKQLSRKHKNNPFYQISRGMPGTHKVKDLFSTLQKAKAGKHFSIPVFDKSLHNAQGGVAKTKRITKKLDFLLFEGWCVGIPTVTSSILQRICKKHDIDLKKLDPQLNYHKAVLKYIPQYQKLWEKIDYVISIKPDCVYSAIYNCPNIHKEWRFLQAKRLCKAKGKCMTKEEVNYFVDIFIPWTFLCYEKIKPNSTIFVDKKHNYYKIKINR